MKTCKFAAFFIMGVSLMAGHSSANPVDLSAPGGELGASNPKGYLEIWREIDGVGLQLGKGSYLPFRYKFSTDPAIGGILGPGFYLPMFEAKNVLIREQVMRAYLPCGKGLYFWRDTVDPNKFQTVDKGWTGYVTGDDFTVWRDDGWKVLYHKSRLTSITSDDNHTFTWSYDGIGAGASVSEDGQTILTMEPNVAGQVAAFIFGGKRYEVEYAERPVTEMLMGQVAIKELDQALTSFKYPDGTMDTFKFVLTSDLVPTLTFTDKDKQQTLYTWAAATDYLATEKGPKGNWTYKIGEIAQDFGLPPITRTNSSGKTESMAVDTKMGTYTSTAVDGAIIVTHVFETPGPLYHKVHEIDKSNGNITTTIYRASYDETGKLIREMDEKGYISILTYDDEGKFKSRTTTLPTDSELLAKLKAQGQALLALIAKSTNEEERQDALRDLAQYYMFEMLDPARGAGLLRQLDHKHAYIIRIQELEANPVPTRADQIKAYEDILKDYPEYKDRLGIYINIAKGK
jgi:YD repeat-containing protein